jgi:hypothetical protein
MSRGGLTGGMLGAAGGGLGTGDKGIGDGRAGETDGRGDGVGDCLNHVGVEMPDTCEAGVGGM